MHKESNNHKLQTSNGAYDAQKVESKMYKLWQDSGFFNPDNLPKRHRKPFSMVLPPPNVTGTLHIGHALTVTIEDIIIRYQRMLGRKTLWVSGTDHASIATEQKFLKETGIRKSDYNTPEKRDDFIKLVGEYAIKNQKVILKQLKAMGASLDWPDDKNEHDRLAFTMDDKRKWAVYKAFEQLYNEGLIYRGLYLIKWDPKGRTGVSNEEIVHELVSEPLYTFKYNKDFPFAISTYRPETKLADIAVAVHPNDERYKRYIGKKYNGLFPESLKIKIIADEKVDPKFGTGAVGLTPAHSEIDKEIARRHNLLPKRIDEIQLINEDDTLLSKTFIPEEYRGRKKLEVQKKLVDYLEKEKLLEKQEIIPHEVPKAQRTNGRIEILPHNDQCFIDIDKKIAKYKNKTLQDLMLEPVAKGKIEIIPKHFKKIYINWIKNLHDWNISRQVWYGHRIPFWYCKNKHNKSCYNLRNDNPILSFEKPKECPRCKGVDTYQDSDTLDTWFSSGLWTFSTLGWPNEKSKDLENYHPTDVLETGYDILFFWIARMILMSTFLLDEVPFRKVYLHGLVRDAQGRKMSKSLGNVIDPLVMTEKYGTDALRFALIFGTAPGTDLPISEDRIKGMKHFANKIWNASKFVLMNTQDYKLEKSRLRSNRGSSMTLSSGQKKYVADFKKVVKRVTKQMDEFKFYSAAEDVYHYFWHTFCDKIIEESKKSLAPGAKAKERLATQHVLLSILNDSLKLLHPFMPFITEEIYQKLPMKNKQKTLMIENWPS